MKKIIALLILVAALCGKQSIAQFRWGPTAGIDYTTLKFSQVLFNTGSHVGAQAGVQCEMMFPGIGFGIDFGAMYETRGATMDLGSKKIWASQGYGRESLTGHYLTIPVDLRFKWTRMNGIEDYIAPFVYGGPVIGFQLAHSSLDAFEHKTLDLGIQAGLGFQLFKRWQIQAAYVWGMSDAVRCKDLVDFNGSYEYWTFRVTRFF